MAFYVQSIDRQGIQGQIANPPFLLQLPIPHHEQRQIGHAELQLEWSFTDSLLVDQAARPLYLSDRLSIIRHSLPISRAWTSGYV
jgi:hypothetical protein